MRCLCYKAHRFEKSTHTDLFWTTVIYIDINIDRILVKGHIPSLFSISGIRIWTSYSKCSKGLPPAELDIDLPSPLMKIPSLFVLPQCPLTPHPLHPIYFFQFSPTRQATLLVGSPTHFKFQNAHFQKRLRRRKMCTTPSFCLSFSLFE